MYIHMVDPQMQKTIAQRSRIIQRWHDTDDRPAILLMSYDQFKLLVSGRARGKMRKELQKRLLDPGPDIVVLDEGHIIANNKTSINGAVMEFKTHRRLILTGTPLSNNLREYHSMVRFVHHDLLSSENEFRSRFVLPIEAGQYMDASDDEVRLMKRRVHVLNQKLKPIIHRRGYDILEKSLPTKHEYILSVRLSDTQKKLYKMFLKRRENKVEDESFFHAWHSLQQIWNHPRALEYAEEQRKQNNRRTALKREMDDFLDDGSLESFHDGDDSSLDEKSWHGSDSEKDDNEDHVMEKGNNDVNMPTNTNAEVPYRNKEDSSPMELDGFGGAHATLTAISHPQAHDQLSERISSTDEQEVSQHQNDSKLNSTSLKPQGSVDSQSHTGDNPPGQNEDVDCSAEWWKNIMGKCPNDLLIESGKFQILKQIICALRLGDKIGIFSQSLGVLNLIESWLGSDCDNEFEFCKGIDLLRIDGSTPSEKRQQFCAKINDAEDPARVMLVSVKAGALGINLVGINRLVLFDTSFNPTHDVQAIFRAYRFGQTRPVSVYRLISAGTMEERIYQRQVEKRALFSRVIDEQQIERHFSKVDVSDMIGLDEDEDESERTSRATDLSSKINYKTHLNAPPHDLLFGKILMEDRGSRIPRYHEHDTLLDHKEDEELTEEEKKEAWAEFLSKEAEENAAAKALAKAQNVMAEAQRSNVPTQVSTAANTATPSLPVPGWADTGSYNQAARPQGYLTNYQYSQVARPQGYPTTHQYSQAARPQGYPTNHQYSQVATPQGCPTNHQYSQVATPQGYPTNQPHYQLATPQGYPTNQPHNQQARPQGSYPTEQPYRATVTGYLLRLHFRAPYTIIGPIRISSPGTLGFQIATVPVQAGGENRVSPRVTMVQSTSPGMAGESSGIRPGDVLLHHDSDQLVGFEEFVSRMIRIRPVVFNVARRVHADSIPPQNGY